MKKYLFILLALVMNSTFALQDDYSFFIELREGQVRITSPDISKINSTLKLKGDDSRLKVSLVFDNKGLDKIFAQLKNDDGVLKRFAIKAGENKTIELEKKQIKNLFFVQIAPPFQEIPLEFSQGTYEIPSPSKEE